MASTDIIYSKTEMGREEMATRAYGLNPSQRRILILVDGKKSANALAEMNPALAASGQVDAILTFLQEQGFIAATDGKHSHPPEPQPTVAPLPVAEEFVPDAAKLRQVKDFMTTTAHTYLGLLSASLIQRIEQARTVDQLTSLVGQWNMALRDSAHGKRFADFYLEQVRAALKGNATLALEVSA